MITIFPFSIINYRHALDTILTHSISQKGHCCFKSSKIISTTKCRTSLRLSACQIVQRCLQAYLSFMKSLSSNINPPIFYGASHRVVRCCVLRRQMALAVSWLSVSTFPTLLFPRRLQSLRCHAFHAQGGRSPGPQEQPRDTEKGVKYVSQSMLLEQFIVKSAQQKHIRSNSIIVFYRLS